MKLFEIILRCDGCRHKATYSKNDVDITLDVEDNLYIFVGVCGKCWKTIKMTRKAFPDDN